MIQIELSDVPSEMIEQALADLEAVEKNPRYRVGMVEWHEPRHKVCHVCMAGAVIARCGADPNEYLLPENFSDADAVKLRAIDLLRIGWVNSALSDLGKETSLDWEEDVVITSYHVNPARFKTDMRALAAMLREEGL